MLESDQFILVLWQEKRGNREYTRLQKALTDCQEAADISLPSIAQQLKDNVDAANRTCMSTVSHLADVGFSWYSCFNHRDVKQKIFPCRNFGDRNMQINAKVFVKKVSFIVFRTDCFVIIIIIIIHCVQKKNTHSRFLLYLPGKWLDLHKIFRECLRWIKYSIDVKVKYSLQLVTSFWRHIYMFVNTGF